MHEKLIKLVMGGLLLSLVFFIFVYVLKAPEKTRYEIRSVDNSVYLTNNYEIDSVRNCIIFQDVKKSKIKICGSYTITER